MKKKPFILLLAFGTIVCIYSCTQDKTVGVDCSAVNVAKNTYDSNIGPNITDLYCNYAPCHDHATASGGVDMSTYSGVVNAFKNVQGAGGVICAVTGGCELMPKGGPMLPDSLIKQMKCWQANGYPLDTL